MRRAIIYALPHNLTVALAAELHAQQDAIDGHDDRAREDGQLREKNRVQDSLVSLSLSYAGSVSAAVTWPWRIEKSFHSTSTDDL